MTKHELLDQMEGLSNSIVVNIVVFDDGCQFDILTSKGVYSCLIGGAFPLNGPFKLSPAQQKALVFAQTHRGEDSLEEAIDKLISRATIKDCLDRLIFACGEEAIVEVLKIKWPPRKTFYVFHDMGCDVSAMFPSLQAAYDYFIEYFTNHGEARSWKSMSKDELIEWHEWIKLWRAEGSKKLPVRELFGAYYSPYSGTGNW